MTSCWLHKWPRTQHLSQEVWVWLCKAATICLWTAYWCAQTLCICFIWMNKVAWGGCQPQYDLMTSFWLHKWPRTQKLSQEVWVWLCKAAFILVGTIFRLHNCEEWPILLPSLCKCFFISTGTASFTLLGTEVHISKANLWIWTCDLNLCKLVFLVITRLFNGDGSCILDGMLAQSLVIIHDGSYMKELLPNISLAATMIYCTIAKAQCKCTWAKKSTSAAPYHGEILGGVMTQLILNAAASKIYVLLLSPFVPCTLDVP